MSSSETRRGFLALLAALGLSGCFRPMLARDGAAGSLRGRVLLPDVTDRLSYFLRQSLREQFGDTEAADFRLNVSTSVEERGLAIAEDNSVTRISLRATSNFTLVRIADSAAVLKGTVASESGFNSTSSLYATRQIEEDVRRRLAEDLGARMARRIYAAADGFAAL